MRFDSFYTGSIAYFFVSLLCFFSDAKYSSLKRLVLILGIIFTSAISLQCIQNLTYELNQPWNVAKQFLENRIKINDQSDNSGIDKNKFYLEKEIDPDDVLTLRSFIYSPTINLQSIKKIREIYAKDQHYLIDNFICKTLSLKKIQYSTIKNQFNKLPLITKWSVFILSVIIYIFFLKQTHFSHFIIITSAILGYTTILLLMQRIPDRVFSPYLYIFSLLLFTSLLDPKNQFRKIKFLNIIIPTLCIFTITFLIREERHLMKNIFGNKSIKQETCFDYFEQHKNNTFINFTTQTHHHIFSSTSHGYTLNYLKNSNVIQCGDGWMFYSPAYNLFLSNRGIGNPYKKLLESNTYFVVPENASSNMMSLILKLVTKQSKQPVKAQIVKSIPPCLIMQIRRID